MRNLGLSRSSQPQLVSLSQLFLSLATGILLIAHHRYLRQPIASQQSSIQPVMAFMVLVSLIKSLALFRLFRAPARPQERQRTLTRRNMMYPGLARAGTYVCLVILVSSGRSLSMSIVIFCSLTFIFWLTICSNDNNVAKTIKKGRNFSPSPIKQCLLFALTLLSVALQPSTYNFSFELHFQIFLIFIASLLIFSYFYLHKIILTFTTRSKSQNLLSYQSLFELAALVLISLYSSFMEQQPQILAQLEFIYHNWYAGSLHHHYKPSVEIVLWQHIRKLSLSQLIITLTSGFLWLNIYEIITQQIEVRLYVSVVVMATVLLVNIGLVSGMNVGRVHRMLGGKKKRKRKSRDRDVFQDQM